LVSARFSPPTRSGRPHSLGDALDGRRDRRRCLAWFCLPVEVRHEVRRLGVLVAGEAGDQRGEDAVAQVRPLVTERLDRGEGLPFPQLPGRDLRQQMVRVRVTEVGG
jgi:hypothetical protein